MSYATSLPAATTGQGNAPVSSALSYFDHHNPLDQDKNEHEEHGGVLFEYMASTPPE